MLNFHHYIEKRNLNENVSAEAKEGLREIQVIINETINRTTKPNGYGIDQMKFEVINEERANGGIQINLEGKGIAKADNKEQVSRLLQKLMANAREPLWQKKIFLECRYHQIDVQENAYEAKDMDSRSTLYFTVICAAIIFVEPMVSSSI